MTVVINVLMTLHVSGSVGLRLIVYSINAPSSFLDCEQKWVYYHDLVVDNNSLTGEIYFT